MYAGDDDEPTFDAAAYLDRVGLRVFGWTPGEAKAEGRCIRCRSVVGPLTGRDEREYAMSAVCPTCFDEVAGDK